jgi:hypothetical protein
MNCSGNVRILSVDIANDLTVIAVQSDILTGESNLFADLPGYCFEVNL